MNQIHGFLLNDTLSEDKEPVCVPAHCINQVLFWIQDNQDLLHEARDASRPLLERVNLLVTFAHNLDNFFMNQVSGLHRQIDEDVPLASRGGKTHARLLDEIYEVLSPLLEELVSVWQDDLIPALLEHGISIHSYDSLNERQMSSLRTFFLKEVFPVLTPLPFDRSHPFPFISNHALNLAIIVRERGREEDLFVRIKVPNNLFPRLLQVPDQGNRDPYQTDVDLIYLEDIISANLDLLFPGMNICAAYPFRVTRDAVAGIAEDAEADSLIRDDESARQHRIGVPVRIEVSSDMDRVVCGMICDKLIKYSHMFYRTTGPVGMADLSCLLDLDRPDLKNALLIQDLSNTMKEDKTTGMSGSFHRVWRLVKIVSKNVYDSLISGFP